MLEESGHVFKEPEIMIYLIIELVSGASYSSILYNQPAPLEELKPHIFEIVRHIIKEHYAKTIRICSAPAQVLAVAQLSLLHPQLDFRLWQSAICVLSAPAACKHACAASSATPRMAEQILKNSCHCCFSTPPSCIIGIQRRSFFMQEQPIDQEAAARGKRRLITIFCVMITILLLGILLYYVNCIRPVDNFRTLYTDGRMKRH